MSIQLLAAIPPAWSSAKPPLRPGWSRNIMFASSGWVSPGDNACVCLLDLNGHNADLELLWGKLDPATGLLEPCTNSGKSFAWRCLVPASRITLVCDAGEFADKDGSTSVTFAARAPYGCAFAGTWIPANPHGYEPAAFQLIMAPAGPDLAPYCLRQPVVIAPEHRAAWLNPTVSPADLLKAPVPGTFEVLETKIAASPPTTIV